MMGAVYMATNNVWLDDNFDLIKKINIEINGIYRLNDVPDLSRP